MKQKAYKMLALSLVLSICLSIAGSIGGLSLPDSSVAKHAITNLVTDTSDGLMTIETTLQAEQAASKAEAYVSDETMKSAVARAALAGERGQGTTIRLRSEGAFAKAETLALTVSSQAIASLEKVKNTSLAIDFEGHSSLTFDADAVAALVGKPCDKLTVSLQSLESANVLGEQKARQESLAFSVEIRADKEKIIDLQGGAITAAIHIGREIDETAQGIEVFRAQAGKTKALRAKYEASSGQMLFQMKTLDPIAIGVFERSGEQDPWHQPATNFLQETTTLLEPYQTQTGAVDPDQEMTKGKAVALLMDAYGLTKQRAKEAPPPGIDENTWYAAQLHTANAAGLLHSLGASAFDPDETITRQEMFVLIGQTLAYLDYDIKPTPTANLMSDFHDLDQISAEALPIVETLVEGDIVHGWNGQINPNAPLTQAEAFQLMFNLLA